MTANIDPQKGNHATVPQSADAQASQALALLRGTLDATNDAILVTDADHNVLVFNKRFIELWNLPKEVLSEKNHDAIIAFNSKYFAESEAFLARAKAIQNSQDKAFDELRLEDGRVFERVSQIQTLDGRAIGRVWNVRDVTLARKLEESQARLVAIVDSADDAIVGKTLTSVITSWNRGAVRIFGYSADEAIGKSVRMLIPPERQSEEDEILNRINRGERIEHYQAERVRKDGSRIKLSLSISPIKDTSGKIIGASKIARDMREQIKQQEALKDSEERLRAVLEASPECVKIVAADGTLQYMNHAGLCMIEYDGEDAPVGSSVYELIAQEHREAWIEKHGRICAGERLNWEFEIIGRKGTRRWMESHAVPLALPDGSIAHLAVTRDINARKKHEEERDSLLESERFARSEAERASHLKDEFLATLSHELRTPLNAILGWSQLLIANPDKVEMREGLDAIQRNARAQTQLIEDLLDMSRIISGKVRLDIQSTELAEVIDAAFEAVRLSAEAKGIRLRKILDFDAGPVSGDPTRLQQVVWNLLSNALKFTPKGGKVDVLLERVNSHLEITVHDSGVGIKPEFLPSVFERFRQADASTTRSYGGLGLGLSIVKHLVELHGGTVRAKSPGEGLGATFIVSLPQAPIRRGETREHRKAPSAPTIDYDEVRLEGIKVLLVDDEPDARTLITRLLTQCGAQVIACANADEGLTAVSTFKPHVVISDIGMPGKDGYQFIRELRQIAQDLGQSFPTIALTAFARSEDRTRAMMAGFQVHIAKPIEPQELLATVGSLAGRTG